MDALTLRLATDADVPFLRRVYASTRELELSVIPWSDEQKAQFVNQQFDAQDFHYRKYYPTAEFLIIERHGEPVGRLYVDRWESQVRIIDIAVLPEFRGAGIGTALLTALQQEAAAAAKALSIHVEVINPARRLYDRLGFLPVEDKGLHILMEWRAA